MNIPIPQPTIEMLYIPTSLIISLIWFMFLWMFEIFYGRCECGAFYHTKKEKKEFINFVWFTVLSSIVIFAGGLLIK